MTYIIVSDDTIKIEKDALEFAKTFNPSDVFWIKRIDGKKELTVEAVTKMVNQSNLASVSGKKLFIIFESELMNANAQNKLLKTIEDANDDTTVLFLCKNLNNILSTIKSRSIIIYKQFAENRTIKKMIAENIDSKQIFENAEKILSTANINQAISLLPIFSKPENIELALYALNKAVEKFDGLEEKKLSIYRTLSMINKNIEANCNATNAFDLLLLELFGVKTIL